MGAASRYLIRSAQSLADQGIAVLLADPRGIGASPPIPSAQVDFSMFDHLELDWPAFIAEARKLAPGTPIFIGGHSLGGQLSALYVSANPAAVDGLVTLAACALSFRLWPWPSRWVIATLYRFFALASRVCGYLPGHRLGWGAPCSRTATLEWSRWGLEGHYSHRDGGSLEALFADFCGEALVVSFDDDRRYAPKRAVDALAARFSSGKVERWHLAPEELGLEAVGHFGLRSAPELWRRLGLWMIAPERQNG